LHRNETFLDKAILDAKLIAGMVQLSTNAWGAKAFEFQVVFCKPVRQHARRKVIFNDKEGVYRHGLWCAPLEVCKEECVPSTLLFSDIQKSACMSAVAIPLRYILDDQKDGKPVKKPKKTNVPVPHVDRLKYCVITNWWKYRMKDGKYRLPTLDPSLYDAVRF
jgi:hypothetical protein